MHFYLSRETKLMLYYTLTYPYITYCNSTWSSTYVSNLNRIYYLQKWAVRAITNSDYWAHTAPLFSKMKILDIFQINTLDTAKFMFRYHNNLLPPLFLNGQFQKISIPNHRRLPCFNPPCLRKFQNALPPPPCRQNSIIVPPPTLRNFCFFGSTFSTWQCLYEQANMNLCLQATSFTLQRQEKPTASGPAVQTLF